MKNNYQISFWSFIIILFLPIIVLPPTFQPSDWTRTILLRVILTVFLSFFLYRFFYKKDASFSIPQKNSLVWLPMITMAAFFVVLVLSTIFSEDIRFSIFGSPSRAGGALTFLFYFLFALALAIFTKEDNWEKFWKALFATGILASLLAIVQYFNLLKNIFVAYEGSGTPSLLGNSTFLAIFMLFLALFAFVFFIQENNKNKKFVYLGLFLLFCLTIIITGSRATYLAMAASLFFFFLFYPKKFKNIKIVSASIIIVAVLTIALFNLFPQQLAKNDILSTISERLSLKTIAKDLLGTRFETWKITLQAIKDKPILGYGPENFYIGFEKYYNSNVPGFQGLWWDRPHNAFLEMFVNSGLFAFIFYIAFWIVLLWQLQKFKRQQGENIKTYMAHGLQAMFLGYLLTLFFNFDSFATYLISFFFIGYAFYLLSGQDKIKIMPIQKPLPAKKFIGTAYILLIILFIWFWNIKPLYLNEKIHYANNLVSAEGCDTAVGAMNEIFKSGGIIKTYSALKYATALKTCVSFKPEKEVEYANKALETLKQASILQPKFSRTWILMGSFANVLAAREQNQDNKNKFLTESINYLEKAKKLSPGRLETIFEIEKNYLVAKNYEAMKKTAEDCIKINSDNGSCYWYLGVAEIFLGDQKNGKIHIAEAERKTSSNFSYIQLAVAYLSQNNYTDAILAYENVIHYDPKNASYHAALAFLYKKVGRYTEAGREALRVFELQPDNKDAMDFIQGLMGQSPNDPTLHGTLAYIYATIGKKDKAKQELLIAENLYIQLISVHPNTVDYYYNLAKVYKELGAYESSYNEKAYKNAIITQRMDQKNYEKRVSELIERLPGDYFARYHNETF